MTVAATEKHFGIRINWLCVQKVFQQGLIIGAAFALGGWVVSIRVQEASLPYLQKSTSQLETIHKEVGANPLAAVKCAERQAGRALDVAGQAVASAENYAVPEPSLSTIPKCPPLPAPKPAVTADRPKLH